MIALKIHVIHPSFCFYRLLGKLNLAPLFFSRLQAIEKERSPQVLAIQHGEEEEADSEEEEGFGGVRSDSSDEEHCGSLDTTSPHSSLQALSSGKLLTD